MLSARAIFARGLVVVSALALEFLFCLSLARSNEWVELAPMNRRRGEHANAVIDGKIYVLGGIFDSIDGPDEIEMFDPATNVWTDIGTMPLEPENRSRHHFNAGSAVYGNEIWVVGGKPAGDATGVNFVDVYNVATGEWRLGPDLPEVIWGGPSVIVGDTLHAFAGAQGRTDTENLHYSLDLTNPQADWQREVKVPRPRVHAGGAAVGEKIYLIGGELQHIHDGDTKTVQIYDTITEQWSFGADLPLARSHTDWATFAHLGEIWSVSGVDSSNAPNRGQAEIFIYNPTEDAWREFEYQLPVPLVSPGAKVIGNTLYVYGGGENDWFEGEMRKTYALELPLTAVAGDLNSDGTVSGSDYLAWQRSATNSLATEQDLFTWQQNYASPSMAGIDGDFDNDGLVAGNDLLVWQQLATLPDSAVTDLATWRANYGDNIGAQLTEVAVPEPGACVAMIIAIALGCASHRWLPR